MNNLLLKIIFTDLIVFATLMYFNGVGFFEDYSYKFKSFLSYVLLIQVMSLPILSIIYIWISQ